MHKCESAPLRQAILYSKSFQRKSQWCRRINLQRRWLRSSQTRYFQYCQTLNIVFTIVISIIDLLKRLIVTVVNIEIFIFIILSIIMLINFKWVYSSHSPFTNPHISQQAYWRKTYINRIIIEYPTSIHSAPFIRSFNAFILGDHDIHVS